MPAVRMQEPPAPAGERLDPDRPLVNQAVVQPAQRDQVIEFGRSAVGPVLDVVRIEVALVGAAGEAATGIPGVKGTADRRRNAARLASHIERRTLFVLE